MNQSMTVLTSTETVEWYTPPEIIERARQVLGGIDLDPASNDIAQRWIQASVYYTAATPLQAPWAGRVWLNPPFDDTPAWVNRLEREFTRARRCYGSIRCASSGWGMGRCGRWRCDHT